MVSQDQRENENSRRESEFPTGECDLRAPVFLVDGVLLFCRQATAVTAHLFGSSDRVCCTLSIAGQSQAGMLGQKEAGRYMPGPTVRGRSPPTAISTAQITASFSQITPGPASAHCRAGPSISKDASARRVHLHKPQLPPISAASFQQPSSTSIIINNIIASTHRIIIHLHSA